MQKNKLYISTFVLILYQLVTIIVGLIIPRMIILTYGSDVNGLTSSITQMLGFISLLELGIGAIVQSSFYKPLAENDTIKISLIYIIAQKYFRTIAKILFVYIIILCIYYGIFQSDSFSWFFNISLIISISISLFAQYYFGLCNVLVLNADQKVYVTTLVNLIAFIINAFTVIILMKTGFSIQFVKLITSIFFLVKFFF